MREMTPLMPYECIVWPRVARLNTLVFIVLGVGHTFRNLQALDTLVAEAATLALAWTKGLNYHHFTWFKYFIWALIINILPWKTTGLHPLNNRVRRSLLKENEASGGTIWNIPIPSHKSAPMTVQNRVSALSYSMCWQQARQVAGMNNWSLMHLTWLGKSHAAQ